MRISVGAFIPAAPFQAIASRASRRSPAGSGPTHRQTLPLGGVCVNRTSMVETERFFWNVDRASSKPTPDVARFPPRGISSLEGCTISRRQLQLCHCTAAEWPVGWLLESCQRDARRHHCRASGYCREYPREDHVL